MRLTVILIAPLFLLSLISCTNSAAYEQKSHMLDSLGGAVSNLAAALQKHDSTELRKYIDQFGYYSSFIEASQFDTIGKQDADQLQDFYRSGNALKKFLENRAALLARVALLNSQYRRLAEDIRNHSISIEEADSYVLKEKKEAAYVVEAGNQQQQLFYRSLEQYRLSVRDVQQIIKRYNNGQLPTIVNDSIPQL